MKDNLMKKMILPMLLFVLASCGAPGNNAQSSITNSISLSPIQALSDDEEHIYKIFIAFATATEIGLHNPSVARITTVDSFRTLDNTSEAYVNNGWKHFAMFRVQGTNLAGGTISKNYLVYVDENWSFDYGREMSSIVPNPNITSTNIGNINRAIAFYWSELGL